MADSVNEKDSYMPSDLEDQHIASEELTQPEPANEKKPPQLVSLFSTELHHLHKKVWVSSGINLLIMCTAILGILSVYWGSVFNRAERAHNFDILVLDYDQAPNSDTSAFVGPSLTKLVNALPQTPTNLHYRVQDPNTYKGDFSTLVHDVTEQVAWGIIAIAPNASTTLLNALQHPSADFSPRNLAFFYFPEARQDAVYDGVVIPLVQRFADQWTAQFRKQFWPIVNRTLPTV